MKYFYFLFSTAIATILFSSCAGNKDLQEKAPANMETAYYTSQGEMITLYISVASLNIDRVSLGGVYFRNKKANLISSEEIPRIYTATFNMRKEDMIMSSDPKEEYGNKVPQKQDKMDFELNDDEAVLIYTQNSEVKYYKLTGVKERV